MPVKAHTAKRSNVVVPTFMCHPGSAGEWSRRVRRHLSVAAYIDSRCWLPTRPPQNLVAGTTEYCCRMRRSLRWLLDNQMSLPHMRWTWPGPWFPGGSGWAV